MFCCLMVSPASHYLGNVRYMYPYLHRVTCINGKGYGYQKTITGYGRKYSFLTCTSSNRRHACLEGNGINMSFCSPTLCPSCSLDELWIKRNVMHLQVRWKYVSHKERRANEIRLKFKSSKSFDNKQWHLPEDLGLKDIYENIKESGFDVPKYKTMINPKSKYVIDFMRLRKYIKTLDDVHNDYTHYTHHIQTKHRPRHRPQHRPQRPLVDYDKLFKVGTEKGTESSPGNTDSTGDTNISSKEDTDLNKPQRPLVDYDKLFKVGTEKGTESPGYTDSTGDTNISSKEDTDSNRPRRPLVDYDKLFKVGAEKGTESSAGNTDSTGDTNISSKEDTDSNRTQRPLVDIYKSFKVDKKKGTDAPPSKKYTDSIGKFSDKSKKFVGLQDIDMHFGKRSISGYLVVTNTCNWIKEKSVNVSHKICDYFKETLQKLSSLLNGIKLGLTVRDTDKLTYQNLNLCYCTSESLPDKGDNSVLNPNVGDVHTSESSDESSGHTSYSSNEVEDFSDIEEDIEPVWIPPVSLTRGKLGVYDVEDLVTVLKDEKAQDVCVIKLPVEVQLAHHMVIASAMSVRHMMALSQTVNWVYKQKKSKKDPFIKIEGKETKDWLAFDMGNIILHIFMPETRELYDLEMLWTVGPKFDEQSQDKMDVDRYNIDISDIEWLQELDQSNNAKTKKDKKK